MTLPRPAFSLPYALLGMVVAGLLSAVPTHAQERWDRLASEPVGILWAGEGGGLVRADLSVQTTTASAAWRPSARAAALVAPQAAGGALVREPLWRTPRQEYDDSPMAGMTGSGFFLGIIGMLAGAAVGSSVAGSCEAVCRRDQAAAGAMVGGALLIPLGVHIANPDPGSFLAGTATSALLGVAIWGLVTALPSDPMPLAPFLAAPLQLQGAIFAEGRFR